MRSFCLAAWFALAPSGPEDLFQVRNEGRLVFVSANVTGISAHAALTTLCRQLGWRLTVQDTQVGELLEQNPVDLSFSERSPSRIAELIAMSSGLDVFVAEDEAGTETTVTVVAPPAADTVNGRRRLREWAIRWYGNLLESNLRSTPETAGEEGRIRFALGQLNQESGDLEGAAREFERLRSRDRSHPLVPRAILEAARCNLALGRYPVARMLAEEVSRSYPHLPEGSKAAIVLGQALIADQKYDDAVRSLELRASMFAQSEDATGILLLLADAYRLRGRPDQVLTVLDRVSARDELAREDHLLFEFLAGSARAELGDAEAAAVWLTSFISRAADHAYLGEAFVAYAHACFDSKRDFEALAAAREARKHEATLPAARIEQRASLEFRAAVRLGLPGALPALEGEVYRRGPTEVPGLALFLGEAFLEEGQWESAKRVLVRLDGVAGPEGDRARYLVLLAWWRQGMPAEVVQRARSVATRVQDPAVQGDVARLAGDALRALGRPDDAAEAYLGRIR